LARPKRQPLRLKNRSLLRKLRRLNSSLNLKATKVALKRKAKEAMEVKTKNLLPHAREVVC